MDKVIFDCDKVRRFIIEKNEKLCSEYVMPRGDGYHANTKRKVLYSNNDFASDAGISASTFGRILSKNYNPRLDMAYLIAKQMNCKIDDLIIKK